MPKNWWPKRRASAKTNPDSSRDDGSIGSLSFEDQNEDEAKRLDSIEKAKESLAHVRRFALYPHSYPCPCLDPSIH